MSSSAYAGVNIETHVGVYASLASSKLIHSDRSG